MKHLHLHAAGAIALACIPLPALAQDDATNDAAALYGALTDGVEVEPLTLEQQARLPLARRVVDAMLPTDSFAEAASGRFGAYFGTTGEETAPDPSYLLFDTLGYAPELEGIAPAKAEQALDIIDPGWRERQQAEFAAMLEISRQMMAAIEPVMRETMSELYAIHFSAEQLADIETFFGTESGAAYARESFSMSNDPRLMAAVYSNPAIWAGMDSAMTSTMDSTLTPQRTTRGFDELSDRERDRLAALTGMSVERLEESFGWAAEIFDIETEAEAVEAAAETE